MLTSVSCHPTSGRGTGAQSAAPSQHHLLTVPPLQGTDLLHGPPPSPLPSMALPAPLQGPGSPALAGPSGSLQGPSPLGLLPRTGWLMLLSTSSGFLWSSALVPTIHITLTHLNCVL